jgi:hypothetical protein
MGRQREPVTGIPVVNILSRRHSGAMLHFVTPPMLGNFAMLALSRLRGCDAERALRYSAGRRRYCRVDGATRSGRTTFAAVEAGGPGSSSEPVSRFQKAQPVAG